MLFSSTVPLGLHSVIVAYAGMYICLRRSQGGYVQKSSLLAFFFPLRNPYPTTAAIDLVRIGSPWVFVLP
jgi:hypothetical protein